MEEESGGLEKVEEKQIEHGSVPYFRCTLFLEANVAFTHPVQEVVGHRDGADHQGLQRLGGEVVGQRPPDQ